MLYCKNLWLSLNQSRFISFLVITLNMQNTHPGRSISFCRCRSFVFRPIFTTGILLFFLLMKRNSASISLFLFVSEAAHNGEWINSAQSLGVIVRHINAGPDLHFSKTLALHSVISINPFAQKKMFLIPLSQLFLRKTQFCRKLTPFASRPQLSSCPLGILPLGWDDNFNVSIRADLRLRLLRTGKF